MPLTLDDLYWRTANALYPTTTGAPLSADQFDANTYALARGVIDLQAALAAGVTEIASITQVSANVMRVTLTDASYVDLTLPTSRPGYAEIAAATKTLALADSYKLLDLTNASGCAITVPPNATEAFSTDELLPILQSGGPLSFVAGAGVTLVAPEGRAGATARKGALVWLKKTGTNIWKLSGDLARATQALATSGAISLNPALGDATITPAGNATINAASVLNDELTIIVTASGTTSRDITFGTGFKSQGPLATGAVDAKQFVIRFTGDGTTYREVSRTVAM